MTKTSKPTACPGPEAPEATTTTTPITPRVLARWELSSALDAYLSARERGAAAAVAWDAYGRADPTADNQIHLWYELAIKARDLAERQVIHAALVATGCYRGDLAQLDSADFAWEPTGAQVGNRIAWVAPGVDVHGKPTRVVGRATLTVFELTEVLDLGETD